MIEVKGLINKFYVGEKNEEYKGAHSVKTSQKNEKSTDQ